MPQHHKIGWALFLLASLLFGWAGLNAGDWLVVIGSAVFAAGCVLFLVESDGKE